MLDLKKIAWFRQYLNSINRIGIFLHILSNYCKNIYNSYYKIDLKESDFFLP